MIKKNIKGIKPIKQKTKIKADKPLEGIGINNFTKDVYNVKIGEFKPIFADKALSYNLPKLNFRQFRTNANINKISNNNKNIIKSNLNYYTATFSINKTDNNVSKDNIFDSFGSDFVNKYKEYIFGDKDVMLFFEDLNKKYLEEYEANKKYFGYNGELYYLTDKESEYFFRLLNIYDKDKALDLAKRMAADTNNITYKISDDLYSSAKNNIFGFNNILNDYDYVNKLYSKYSFYDDNIDEIISKDGGLNSYLQVFGSKYGNFSKKYYDDFIKIYYLNNLNKLNSIKNNFENGIFNGSDGKTNLLNFFDSKIQIDDNSLKKYDIDFSNLPEVTAIMTGATALSNASGLSGSLFISGLPLKLPLSFATYIGFALGLAIASGAFEDKKQQKFLSNTAKDIRILRENGTLMNYDELSKDETGILEFASKYINSKNKDINISSNNLYEYIKSHYIYTKFLLPAQIKFNYIVNRLKELNT